MNGKALHANRPEATGFRPASSSQAEDVIGAKPITCLLIDDNQYDRQRVRRISEQTTLELSFNEVSSLDEALDVLRVQDFDVILLDQNLPDGDGIVAAALLRKHLGGQTPPIIMVSGSVEAAMPARAFASGCSDYISKDGLSIPSFEKAITVAVSKFKAAAQKPIGSTIEHRATLQSFADDTVLEFRIPLSRMLRLISRATDLHPSAASELGDLKAACREMWDYLDNVHQTAAERR
ncbi:MAG TPA: response regulator [Thermohalobaculum sp.]|nr:response regulator [Thermohalobaculum sp.]